MTDRMKRLEDYEGILLVFFVATYGTLTAAWDIGGPTLLVAALIVLAVTVIALLLSGRAGIVSYHLWFIFVVTSALVLSSSLRERFDLSSWPERLVLTLVGSLIVGVSIAPYRRCIAPHIRGPQGTPSGSHDRI